MQYQQTSYEFLRHLEPSNEQSSPDPYTKFLENSASTNKILKIPEIDGS